LGELDLLVLAAYMVGIVAAGFWARRKANTQEQFLVAGRSVGPWLYSGTLAAIVLGGASTIGAVKLGYQYGISALSEGRLRGWRFQLTTNRARGPS
jgi:SSS family solute:Na+ symporter